MPLIFDTKAIAAEVEKARKLLIGMRGLIEGLDEGPHKRGLKEKLAKAQDAIGAALRKL